jgi:hypothetical protein
MMGSVSVNPSPEPTSVLLQLLAEPEKLAAKVKEFAAAKLEHDNALEALTGARAELRILHDNLTQDHAKAEAELSAREDALDKRERDLALQQATLEAAQAAHNRRVDERVNGLDIRDAQLKAEALRQAGYANTLNQQHIDLSVKQATLDRIESDVRARSEEASKRLAEAMRAKAHHEGALAKLKAAIEPIPDMPPAPSAS